MRVGWQGGIFLLALLARLAYVAADVDVPPQDTPDYDEIALNLLAGEGFVADDNWFGHPMRSWRAPLYPGLLALVYGLFGYHHVAVKGIQALLGALSAVFVLYLGRRLHPPSAEVGGLMAALYPPLVASANEVMTETLFTALLAAASWLALRAPASMPGPGTGQEVPRHRDTWLAGVLVGLATLTRPVGGLLAPALLLPTWWQTWRAGAPRRWPWRRSGLLLGGVLLSLAPWTVRNGIVHGALVPVSTHGGFILARSNADHPDWRQPDGWRIQPETLQRIPSEVERDRYWRQQGWSWIAAHPAQWSRWVGERFLRFWYFFQPGYNIGFALLLPLALAGMIRFGATPAYRELTWFIVLSILVFSTLLYGSTRFRLPLELFFILYAARVAWQAWHSARRRRWLGLSGGWLILNLVIWWQQVPLRNLLVDVLRAGGLK